jgi:3-phosphoshikimate 1-carboxyvinyltransferase
VTAEPIAVRVPGDKSLTHRALLFAALAEGTSVLSNLQTGGDAQATARVLRALGCALPELAPAGGVVHVTGVGLHGLREPREALDCGNSGTTARLMLGVLAGCPFRSVLTGDASLRSRPMRRVTAPLVRMGARFQELEEPDRLPIAVEGGRLAALSYESPHASAQVKSALILAGMTGGADVTVREPFLSRDHTERLLRAMGADVTTTQLADGGVVIASKPAGALRPLHFAVPGDISAAAFFLAWGLLSRRAVRVEHVGLNPGRTGLLRVLREMGARLEVRATAEQCGEPVGDITAEPSRLSAVSIGGDAIPSLIDEVPVLAVLAARAEGETTIRGAGELRVKESDRLAALASNLRAIGVVAEELPDGLNVRGTDRPLSGRIRAQGDHRIAMAFGILGALPGCSIRIDDAAAAAVSFPGFWDELDAIRTEADRTWS